MMLEGAMVSQRTMLKIITYRPRGRNEIAAVSHIVYLTLNMNMQSAKASYNDKAGDSGLGINAAMARDIEECEILKKMKGRSETLMFLKIITCKSILRYVQINLKICAKQNVQINKCSYGKIKAIRR